MLHKRVTISTGYTLRQMNGVPEGVQKWAPFLYLKNRGSQCISDLYGYKRASASMFLILCLGEN